MMYLGDLIEDASVSFPFTTNDGDGGAVLPSSPLEDADIRVYKDDSATELATNGVTITSPFDSVTGLHMVKIDTSVHADYSTGADYSVVLKPDETVDSQTVVAVLATFSIENRNMKANVVEISGDAPAADALETMLDGTGGNKLSLGGLSVIASGNDNAVLFGGSGSGFGLAIIAESTGVGVLIAGGPSGGTGVLIESAGSGIGLDINDGVTIDGTNAGVDAISLTSGSGANAINMAAGDIVGGDFTGSVASVVDDVTTDTASRNASKADVSALASQTSVNNLPDAEAIADQVWDEVLTGLTHNVPASAGRRLRNLGEIGNYSLGSIWVDTENGADGTDVGENGTDGNPVLTWADALDLSDSTGLTRFVIVNGSSITLSGGSDNYHLDGDAWTLNLNSQSISGLHVRGAGVSGTGTGATPPDFHDCVFAAVTLPPCKLERCGIGSGGGQFTAGAAGEYIFHQCFSVVPGSGTPDLVFTGLGATTGINNRSWCGGANYTLDSDCTLSHEVLAGGGTTITTGGGNAEIRGITRSVTITMSAAETVQCDVITGPIILNGTTTATVKLYGVSGSVTNNTTAAGVTDLTVSGTDQDAILGDTNELQADWTDAGRLDELLDAVKAKTDGLNFTGTDVKATLDGEEVVTDAASRTASKADVSSLALQATLNIVGGIVGSIQDDLDNETDGLGALKAILDAVSTHDAAAVVTAMMANQTDGVALTSLLEAIMAVMFGKATVSGSTVQFKKRDGTTTKVTVTTGANAGERDASTIA